MDIKCKPFHFEENKKIIPKAATIAIFNVSALYMHVLLKKSYKLRPNFNKWKHFWVIVCTRKQNLI